MIRDLEGWKVGTKFPVCTHIRALERLYGNVLPRFHPSRLVEKPCRMGVPVDEDLSNTDRTSGHGCCSLSREFRPTGGMESDGQANRVAIIGQ